MPEQRVRSRENTATEQTTSPQQLRQAIAHRRSVARSFWAFIIPVLILMTAFAVQEVFPFGGRHILTVDLYHQYAPFLGELREKLLSGDSLFFTWRFGLGINFYALFTYYIASPLNLLTVLFPADALSEMVSTLVLLKVGLAGLFFHLFLKKSYRRDGPLALGFSVAYALSGYVMAYFWNIMWLDTISLLPLVVLGMVLLVRDDHVSLYIFSLALLFYCNYYTGFFACLFISFYFFVCLERFGEGKTAAQKVLSVLKILLSSMISLGMTMVTILPTMYALQRTSASGDKFPADFQSFDFYIDFLSRFLPFAKPSIRDGMPNIYVGVFVLFLFFLYFSSKRIPLRRKMINLAVFVFMLFSLNNNYMNFIWHGLHYPNQLPFRNSFVLTFFILAMLYEVMPVLREFEARKVWQFLIPAAVLLMLLRKMDPERYTSASVWTGILFLCMYVGFFALFMRKTNNPYAPGGVSFYIRYAKQAQVVSVMIAMVMLCEIMLNTLISINSVAKKEYFGVRDGYMAGPEVAAIEEAVKRYHKMDNDGPVRMEILPDRSVNDAALYRTNGLTIFSSTFAKAPVRAFGNFGFPNNGINSFQYSGSTPVLDSILGLKYVIYRDKNKIDERVRKLIFENDLISVWESPDALPIAFLAQPALVDENSDAEMSPPTNPFQVQAYYFTRLSGESGVFEFYDWDYQRDKETAAVRLTPETDKNGFSVKRDAAANGSAYFVLKAPKAGNYYISWKLTGMDHSGVSLEDKEGSYTLIGRKPTSVGELGWHEADEEIKIKIDFNDSSKSKSGTLKIYAARLDEERYQAGIEKIKARSSHITEYDSRSFKVKTNAPERSALFVSVTQDPGWQASIDGEPCAIEVIDQCFMAVPVPAGEHTIRFVFTPQGFKTGLILTLGSALLALIIAAVELHDYVKNKRRTRKKTQRKRQETPASAAHTSVIRDEGSPAIDEEQQEEESVEPVEEDSDSNQEHKENNENA